MCRWGCGENSTTYMCKWCGTRYCRECLRGDFNGQKKEPGICKVCNQGRCQGKRVEVYPPRAASADGRRKSGKKGKGRSRSSSPKRSAKKSGKKSAKKR